MRKKGVLITFEGVEGSGKSTQLPLLSDHLKKLGLEVVVTREPGGTALGKEVRSLLVEKKDWSMEPIAELFLYLSDRAQHIAEILQPALQSGKIILCDRFSDATLAYQGYGRGLPIQEIIKANALVTKGIRPSLTFLLDCPIAMGLWRANQRVLKVLGASPLGVEDRFEKEPTDFHQRVRQGYLELAKGEPQRFCVIDASKSEEEIREEILQEVMRFFGLEDRRWRLLIL
ncbi:MAG: dTMP kinase [Deltaproteobacteria bacterium]|nr:dTMP kinase [Deltaproteobacteria bacterium]